MRGWRTLSLQARQLAAASLALVAFLGFTGYALDRAFVDTAQNALRERLADLANGYLSGSELDRGRAFISPENPPDMRFMIPGSGLYASVRGEGLRWESASSLGRSLPPVEFLDPGQRRFEGPLRIIDARGMENSVYAYSIGVIWESAGDFRLTFSVYEDAAQIQDQVNIFRRALWGYLGLAAVLLVLVQVLVLRWSLLPLSNVERELARVRQGKSLRLSGWHPRELESVTESINSLIESERSHLERSRNTLSDLAHSLKTPLAVLRARLDAGASHEELRHEVSAQVQRMNEIVSYQLSRAAQRPRPVRRADRDRAARRGDRRRAREGVRGQGRAVRVRDRRRGAFPRRARRPAGTAGESSRERLQMGGQTRAAERAGGTGAGQPPCRRGDRGRGRRPGHPGREGRAPAAAWRARRRTCAGPRHRAVDRAGHRDGVSR